MLLSQRIRAWLRRRVDPRRDAGPSVEVYDPPRARPTHMRSRRVDRGSVMIVWGVAAVAVLIAVAIALAPHLIASARLG